MPEIGLQRLFSQSISVPRCEQVTAVVDWMGALQAQDGDGVKWSVGLRLPGCTLQEIDAALAAGEIVRTWPMRGTLHLVTAADVHWMLKLMTPRVLAASTRRHRQLELDDAILGRSGELFQQALQGGRCLPRKELLARLEQAGIRTEGQRGYHLLGWHAQRGLICLGPRQDKQPTFVLLDEWVTTRRDYTGEEALAEISRRFFLSHGPATVQDLSRWTGLSLTEARRGLAAVQASLQSRTLNGNTYWQAPDPVQAVSAQTFLLPGFDEYLLGYKDRSAVLAPAFAGRICPGNNGMFLPTLVIEGQVRGTWKRQLRKKQVQVEVFPFAGLSKAEKSSLEPALASYGHFLGLPAEVHFH